MEVKTEIEELLSKYSNRIEILKKRKLYSKWIEHKKKNIQGERKIIPIEKFNKIENDSNIEFPKEIKFFHSNIGNKDVDLQNHINYLYKNKKQDVINYHYSELFAKKIIDEYLSKSEQEREQIQNSIKCETLKSYENTLEFILWEGVEFYDKEINQFNIPFLQVVYEKLNSNKNLLIENFFTWVHCGGGGGFILNTERKGYSSGEQWGYGLEILINNKNYEYISDLYIKSSEYYLKNDIETIKNELRELEKYLKKVKFRFWI